MDILNKYKGTLIGVLLLIAVFLVYANYIKDTDKDPLFSSTKTNPEGEAAGQEIIKVLNEVKEIDLNVKLFQNEEFNALVDYRTTVRPESIGRTNPFEPSGSGFDVRGVIASPSKPSGQIINFEAVNNGEDESLPVDGIENNTQEDLQ